MIRSRAAISTAKSELGTIFVDAGDGNDTVYSDDEYISINGGKGNDFIHGFCLDATIRGGEGDDIISIDGDVCNVYQFGENEGHDLVIGIQEDDTIQIMDGASYATIKSGEEVILYVGNTIATLRGLDGDYIDALNISVESSEPEFNIMSNSNANVSVVGIDGRDHIINYSEGSRSVLDAGKGDDYIDNEGAYSTLIGGDGDDTFYNGWNASLSVIEGGSGNDMITLDSNNQMIRYASGDGNDTVYRYFSTDTIRITDGSTYSTLKSGNDMIVSLASGSIRNRQHHRRRTFFRQRLQHYRQRCRQRQSHRHRQRRLYSQQRRERHHSGRRGRRFDRGIRYLRRNLFILLRRRQRHHYQFR